VSAEEFAGDAFRRLVDRAWNRNRERAATLAAIVEEWQRSGGVNPETRDQARAVAHTVVGSAGTLGHPRGAAVAAQLESDLIDADAAGPVPDRAVELVRRLNQELALPPGWDGEAASHDDSAVRATDALRRNAQ
jgi:HPt (histidine-containing phosphotransfer) domain-containing protein